MVDHGPEYETKTSGLRRGDLVVVVGEIPEDVLQGMYPGIKGVVFEETDYYGDGGGPMVRFENGKACNVYDGWVQPVDTLRDKLEYDSINDDHKTFSLVRWAAIYKAEIDRYVAEWKDSDKHQEPQRWSKWVNDLIAYMSW